MAKILYIFPHPDDESFGPAGPIHAQRQAGHEVYLLTLTKGGATSQRHKLGLTIEEMGEVRYREMIEVAKTLDLTEMTVLDLPDSGLQDIDPRIVERAAADAIRRLQPDVVVTYAVHGMSGFHDHLVTHAAVKRVFLELRDEGAAPLKRLALLAMPDPGGASMNADGTFRFKLSEPERIDVVQKLSAADIDAMEHALACYKTYQSTIAGTRIVERIGDTVYFELFGEDFNPPLGSLTEHFK